MTDENYKKADKIKKSLKEKEYMLGILKEKNVKLVYEDCDGYRRVSYLSESHYKVLKELIETEIEELEKEFEEL